MDTVLSARVRAAGQELAKPGRWRVALDQLDQAVTQLLATPEFDVELGQTALETLYALYGWVDVMQAHERKQLNRAVLELSTRLMAARGAPKK